MMALLLLLNHPEYPYLELKNQTYRRQKAEGRSKALPLSNSVWLKRDNAS